MQKIEPKTWLKVALGVVVVGASAPLIMMFLTGVVALVAGLAVAATAMFFAPWFIDKLANWRLKSIKHEASTNPIETLENDILNNKNEIKAWGQALKDYDAGMSLFIDQARKAVQNATPERQQYYTTEIAKRQELRKRRVEAIKNSEAVVKEKELQLNAMRIDYDFALSMKALDAKAGKFGATQFDDIKVKAAVAGIEKELAASSAAGAGLFQDIEFDPNRSIGYDDAALLEAESVLQIKSLSGIRIAQSK